MATITTINAGDNIGSSRTVINDNFSSVNSDLANKSNVGHTHAISDVTNLQTTLDAKLNTTALGDGSQAIYGDTVRFDTTSLIVAGTDMNTLTTSGFYHGQNLTNKPSGTSSWVHVEIIAGTTDYVVQKVYPWFSTDPVMWIRTKDIVRRTWRRVVLENTTAWTSWTLSRTAGVTLTSITNTGSAYQILGKSMAFRINVTVTPSSSGSSLSLSMPFATVGLSCASRENNNFTNSISGSAITITGTFTSGVPVQFILGGVVEI